MSAVQLVQGHYQEMKALLGEPQQVTVASLEGLGSLSDWWHVFRITQVSLFHNKHIICHQWKFGNEAERQNKLPKCCDICLPYPRQRVIMCSNLPR